MNENIYHRTRKEKKEKVVFDSTEEIDRKPWNKIWLMF